MPEITYDVLIIGAGPGGYVAAIRAAQLGLKTAIVERDRLGGVCLNWGCIPSKALLTNAKVYNYMKNAESWGIQIEGLAFDMAKIIGRSREVADTISKGVDYLMNKNKIDVIAGDARLVDKGKVSVSHEGKTREVTAHHIVVATGARARSIPGVEIDGKKIITARHALELKKLPESVVIVGAGAIGCEFGYFYNSFGSRVTIVEMLDRALPVEDEEVSKELGRSFKKQGIKVLVKRRVEKVEETDSGIRVTLSSEGKDPEEIDAELVLLAVGVQGNVENLGLEDLGINVERGQIKVDRWFQTNVEGIYAIGDVIGPPWLAHVASHEGIVCVEKIAGSNPHPIDYRTIPGCTYCQPQVASVGLTEKAARDEGYEVRVGKFPFRVLGKARASQAEEGFVKLIFEDKYGELIGAHIIGEDATEMIAELVTAKALETTYLELLKTVHAHPTLSEAVMEAAGAAYGEQIHL